MIAALVPVKALRHSKSRLRPVLSDDHRRALVMAMLEDVVGLLSDVPAVATTAVVSPDADVLAFARKLGAQPIREPPKPRGLNAALTFASDALSEQGTSGLLAFTDQDITHPAEYACVKCGQCLEACGNFLNHSRLARLARAGRYEELEKNYVLDCVECGACTYTCPSGVPIVHLIRAAKATIRNRKAQAS